MAADSARRRSVYYTHVSVAAMTADDVAMADALADAAARAWPWWLAGGVLSVLFGVLVLFDLFAGALAVAFLAGLWLLFAGVLDIMASARRRPRWPSIVAGALSIVAGTVCIAWPEITLRAVVVLVGIGLLLAGIVRAISAVVGRGHGWGWSLAAGVTSVVLGLVVLRWPRPTLGVIIVLIGINAIVFGVLEIVAAFGMKDARRNWDRAKQDLELA